MSVSRGYETLIGTLVSLVETLVKSPMSSEKGETPPFVRILLITYGYLDGAVDTLRAYVPQLVGLVEASAREIAVLRERIVQKATAEEVEMYTAMGRAMARAAFMYDVAMRRVVPPSSAPAGPLPPK